MIDSSADIGSCYDVHALRICVALYSILLLVFHALKSYLSKKIWKTTKPLPCKFITLFPIKNLPLMIAVSPAISLPVASLYLLPLIILVDWNTGGSED